MILHPNRRNESGERLNRGARKMPDRRFPTQRAVTVSPMSSPVGRGQHVRPQLTVLLVRPAPLPGRLTCI